MTSPPKKSVRSSLGFNSFNKRTQSSQTANTWQASILSVRRTGRGLLPSAGIYTRKATPKVSTAAPLSNAIRRHLYPKSNSESQYLGAIVKKLKAMPEFKDKQLHVLDMVDPAIVLDGKHFKLNNLPEDWVNLIGPYEGF